MLLGSLLSQNVFIIIIRHYLPNFISLFHKDIEFSRDYMTCDVAVIILMAIGCVLVDACVLNFLSLNF